MKYLLSYFKPYLKESFLDIPKILILVDRVIIEYGNHQELMVRKGKYYQMQQAGVFSPE